MARITGEDKSVFQNIKDFSFYIKAGFRKGKILRSSDFLIKDNRLNLSDEKVKKIRIKMTKKYYRKIEIEKNISNIEGDNTRFEL